MAAIAAHRRLRLALTILWRGGALLAVGAAVVSVVHGRGAGEAAGYALTAALLVALASGTACRYRFALAIGLLVCAVQPVAVVVTAWELTHRIPAAQAAKFRALGVDPTLGVAVNLCLAAYASLVAVWAYRVAYSDSRVGRPRQRR